jgi:hypothetical protein
VDDESRVATEFQMIVQAEAALERDRALVAFLKARIEECAKTAGENEQRLLVGVQRVLIVFAENLEQRHHDPDGHLAGRIEALGWSLRCSAFAAFSEHPDFRMDFKP